MPLLSAPERAKAEAIAALTVTNPFEAERLDSERTALGPNFVATGLTWSFDPTDDVERPNVARIDELARDLLGRMQAGLQEGRDADEADRSLYTDLALYLVFTKFEDPFFRAIESGEQPDFFDQFSSSLRSSLAPIEMGIDVEHMFALFYQLRRAFHYTYRRILGASRSASQLRAAVWQSIFTHDLRRYRDGLYRRMHDVPTLITGPTGTGKELVASAVGLSRYIPYERSEGRFQALPRDLFVPLNLSALTMTLIESELFGHQRGAFTGAVDDREGYLDRPSPWTTIFLDEIGDVDTTIQVKLLRVLETRGFNRLGDGSPRTFGGKIIAATHRDLAAAKADGRFREDFYYRLCADQIRTPSLAEQIADDPEELSRIVGALASRVAEAEFVEVLTEETMRAVETGVGRHYRWPGNVRELEQCVKNVMVRRCYVPMAPPIETDLFGTLGAGLLTADEVLSRYCTLVYVQAGSYEEAARRLLMDRRTVKRRVDPELVERLSER